MLRRAFLPLVASLGLLSGCVAVGQEFSSSEVSRVTNGMTRDQVIAIMGPPQMIDTRSGKYFVYLYMKYEVIANESSSIRIAFGDDGLTYGIPPVGIPVTIRRR